MKLERSRPEDREECLLWLTANAELNDLSPRTLKGATFFKIAGILYLPVKPALMLESLGPNPGASSIRRALALRRAIVDLRKLYPDVEIIFLSRKDARLAECSKAIGFEEAPYAVYRLLDANANCRRAKKIKKRMAQTCLRDNAGTCAEENSVAARPMCNMRESV